MFCAADVAAVLLKTFVISSRILAVAFAVIRQKFL
jgi:hypothetical protein